MWRAKRLWGWRRLVREVQLSCFFGLQSYGNNHLHFQTIYREISAAGPRSWRRAASSKVSSGALVFLMLDFANGSHIPRLRTGREKRLSKQRWFTQRTHSLLPHITLLSYFGISIWRWGPAQLCCTPSTRRNVMQLLLTVLERWNVRKDFQVFSCMPAWSAPRYQSSRRALSRNQSQSMRSELVYERDILPRRHSILCPVFPFAFTHLSYIKRMCLRTPCNIFHPLFAESKWR